ncbi:MAG: DNA polymerase I, partial [Selenomonadales bacterium]|nr:DNA polymerase I [Selenomonadales bacterium]
ILEYRMLTKLKSTYLDAMDGLISPVSGRIHTTFNQEVTVTGRLSSSDPNLQNIPVRTELGREIRSLFIPGKGYDYLMSADYSQIELRVLADISQDDNFVQAFRKGEDIHSRTAAEVFGVSMEDVDSGLRRKAKAVNFGIVYGISDFGLSRDLNVTRKEAKQYIDSYFAKCVGVKKFIDDIVQEAREKGYVTTLFGRRRELPEINSKNFMRRGFAERTAMNTPIQGSAADIIKKAMIEVDRALREGGFKSRMLLQVHDELVIEVVKEELDEVTALVKDLMERAVQLSVPLTVDVNYGANWMDAK